MVEEEKGELGHHQTSGLVPASIRESASVLCAEEHGGRGAPSLFPLLSAAADKLCFSPELLQASLLWGLLGFFSPELFPRPILRANPSSPNPGEPVILTCETQLAPQKSDVRLWFQFFRDYRHLGSGWKGSLRTSIPSVVGNEDPSHYWCEAKTVSSRVRKSSQKLQLPVRSKCGQVLRSAGRSPAEPHISPRSPSRSGSKSPTTPGFSPPPATQPTSPLTRLLLPPKSPARVGPAA